jgi:hypothetical protein
MNPIKTNHKHGKRYPDGTAKIIPGFSGVFTLLSRHVQQLAFPGAPGFGQ